MGSSLGCIIRPQGLMVGAPGSEWDFIATGEVKYIRIRSTRFFMIYHSFLFVCRYSSV